MAAERKNPIPPGRYWIDVIGATQIREFSEWVSEMAGAVVIESSELDDMVSPVESWLDKSNEKSKLWVLFNVPEGRAPFIAHEKFGFPTIADKSVKNRQDVMQAPIPPEPLDELQKHLETGVALLGGIAFILGVKSVLELFSKFKVRK